MALGPKLQLRQTQSLVMTPQLLQSIRLLQLPHAELERFVESEIERNPFLERADEARRARPRDAEARAERRDRRSDWFTPSLDASKEMSDGSIPRSRTCFPTIPAAGPASAATWRSNGARDPPISGGGGGEGYNLEEFAPPGRRCAITSASRSP
jgi:RNA polymerase sigma-54 factor